VGLDWDEGQHLHPDERFLTMVENALQWPSSLGQYLDTAANPLNPYNQGQGSYVYGLLPVAAAKFLGEATGYTGYSGVYLAGRAMSGTLDLLAVVLVFAIGRRLYGVRVGLLGALFLALSVLNIQQSHFFTVDSATAFLVTLALYFAVRVAQGEGRWSILGLGLAFGLAVSAKISVATFLLIIGLAALMRVFGQRSTLPGMTGGPTVLERQLARWRITLIADGGSPPDNIRRVDTFIIRLAQVALLVGVVVFLAFWAFRLAQPQAFEGPGLFGLGINQRWLDDMGYIQKLVSGEIDYPPSHQWADRAPVVYALDNMVRWGLGTPLGIAVWFAWGLMGWQLFRKRQLAHLLPWTWMTLTFFYQSVQFVKTVRYLLPIYPTMALMAAYGLIWLWDRARVTRWRGSRLAAGLVIGVVIAGTAFWAFAFTSIYTRPVTRIAASRWIYEHIPAGSTISFEVWDDPLPLNIDGQVGDQRYDTERMELYWEDIPEKRTQLYESLERLDYIILSSNRLYGSIPRLPSRYPMTTRYYEALFSGELGFERVMTFTSRPQLFGIQLVDDDADESFTVYDHPKVLIFQKRADFSMDAVQALFEPYDLNRIVRVMPKQVTAAPNNLMLTNAEVTAHRQGGTWSTLFDRDGLASSLPVPVWLLCLTVLGLFAFPLAFPALRGMPDGGYLLAKTLGVLLFGYLPWLLASTRLLPFSRGTLWLTMGLLALASLSAAVLQRNTLIAFVRRRWRTLLSSEALFLVAFLGFLWVRAANPDLWHPAMGGEKPMDLAYLNAIVKSTYFPPYDPWFSGGYINYYYFGWVPIAALIKYTGIMPTVAYNLALPMLFALVVSGSAGIAAHLVPARNEDDDDGWFPHPLRWGILAGLLVAVAGNLGEVRLLWQGLVDIGRSAGEQGALGVVGDVSRGLMAVLFHHEAFPFRPEWWYWNASRIMSHGEINEFPYFSFLYGDLHAHVTAMPIFVLAVGLAATLATRAPQRWQLSRSRSVVFPWGRLVHLGLLGLVLGASWCANAWDYPTGVGLAVAALAIAAFTHRRQVDRLAVAWLAGEALLIVALSRLLYQPFHSRYGAAYSSVELWKGERSSLGDILLIGLPFLFVLATYLLRVAERPITRSPWWRWLRLSLAPQKRFARAWNLRQTLVRYPSLLYYLVWMILGTVLAAAIALNLLGHSVTVMLGLLLSIALLVLLRARIDLRQRFVVLMAAAGLALTLGVEWIVLKGDIGRMNTVFKFSLQAWVLWGIASAVALAYLFSHPDRPARVVERAWWQTVLALLAIAMFSYPLLATGAKVDDRWHADQQGGLDGMAYMDTAVYHDNDRELVLSHDAEAIRWLQDNVIGSPVIIEANTPLYRWGGRISVYTGLPAVIGWDWHQKQQRAAVSSMIVDWRLEDLRTLYTSESIADTLALLRTYQVGLIYVGELERAYYPAETLAKFEAMTGDSLERVYARGPVVIYRVVGSGARLIASDEEQSAISGIRDWFSARWIPSRIAAQGPERDAPDIPVPVETIDLLLDVPVEQLPSLSARGWNEAAERSVPLAVLAWWLVIAVIGLAAWPLVATVATAWPDRGYALARGIGLVLVSFVAWIAASRRWAPNTTSTAWGAVAGVAIAALLTGWWKRRAHGMSLGRYLRYAVPGEVVFSVAFACFVLIRVLNPDLWHPWFGGEKMMEMAMLNAVSKSAYLPPYDPYFAGGILNYYYYGYFMVSLLGKLVGLSPEISFNLAVPTFWALTVSHAYVLGRLVLGTGSLRVQQGLWAAALVAVAGNLSGARQVVQQLAATGCPESSGSLAQGIVCAGKGLAAFARTSAEPPALMFDYWYKGTRIIPYTINEFPFFSFLFADLHPHLIAIPMGLLILALCGLAIAPVRRNPVQWLLLGVLAVLCLGALAITNTWDLPVYALICGATLAYVGYRQAAGRGMLLGLGASLALVLGTFLTYAHYLCPLSRAEPQPGPGIDCGTDYAWALCRDLGPDAVDSDRRPGLGHQQAVF
jgi:YYY domain-containing protein